ncbi:MAG: hypothetical protein RL768_2998 [Nitrospirota bacterium]|jgi:hypothetical protein
MRTPIAIQIGRDHCQWRLFILVTGLVLMAVDAKGSEHSPERLDCRVNQTTILEFGLALKAAHFLLNAGPNLPTAGLRGVTCDKAVHGFIARYVELCGRYNAGLVNKDEYEQRTAQIDRMYQVMQETEGPIV